MIFSDPGVGEFALLTGAPAAMGTDLSFELFDSAGAAVIGPATAAIQEIQAGLYGRAFTGPAVGDYLIRWAGRGVVVYEGVMSGLPPVRGTYLTGAPAGIAGQLAVQLLRPDGTVLAAASGTGIAEIRPGVYRFTSSLLATGVIAVWLRSGAYVGVEQLGPRGAGVGLLDLQLAGHTTPGSVGEALRRLIGGPVAVVSPLSRAAELSLVPGDDYMAADNRAIDVVRADGDGWPSDLTGWALRWWARERTSGKVVEATTVTAPTPVGASQAVRVELAGAVTAQLAGSADAMQSWAWGVDGELGGRSVTLRSGALVLAQPSG